MVHINFNMNLNGKFESLKGIVHPKYGIMKMSCSHVSPNLHHFYFSISFSFLAELFLECNRDGSISLNHKKIKITLHNNTINPLVEFRCGCILYQTESPAEIESTGIRWRMRFSKPIQILCDLQIIQDDKIDSLPPTRSFELIISEKPSCKWNAWNKRNLSRREKKNMDRLFITISHELLLHESISAWIKEPGFG